MSRALDNVNPTIFAPTASTSLRRTVKSPKALLWDEHLDDYSEIDLDQRSEDESADGKGGEVTENIDAEEIFGQLIASHL